MRKYLFLALLCLFPATLAAQYKIKEILFVGAVPYPAAQLTLITGLHPGDKLSKPQLQEAAVKLQATGYFTAVKGELEGPVGSVKVFFTVKPVDAALLLPAGFKNLVWFTPEELAAFRTSVPLLTLGIPEAGDQRARVQTALEALLAAKLISATLTHEIVEPTTAHPTRTYEYRADAPEVKLGAAHLTGVSPDMAAGVRTAMARAQRQPYNEGITNPLTPDLLLAPYLDAGYLDAALGGVSRTVASSDAQGVKVDLKANVVPGPVYKVGALSFTPTELVSADAFAKGLKLHVGDVASRRMLLEACSEVTQTYRKQGYLDAYVKIDPSKAENSVSYQLAVVPGDQYRLKSIETKGLPDDLRPEVDKGVKLKAGDVYGEAPITNFLFNQSPSRGMAAYMGNFTASADPNTHLVVVTLMFTHK